jgi:hypothetical protein
VAQPGAIVDVVVADDGALELLGKIGFFIENFPAAEQSDALGAVFFDGYSLSALRI